MAPIVPSLRFERPLWRDGRDRIVGVDEVGVAPTCGAVVAAAVIMRPHCRRIPGVRDSKTLSAAQRERLAPIIRRRAVAVGIGLGATGAELPNSYGPMSTIGAVPFPESAVSGSSWKRK